MTPTLRPPQTGSNPPNGRLSWIRPTRMMVTMGAAADLSRRRANLVQQVHRSRSASDVFAAAQSRLRPLVAFDAASWLGTDPGTGLPASPVRIDELDGVTRAMCSTHWQHELLADDFNLFRGLARADVPVASLRQTVGDELEASPRFRRFLRPLGFADELRTVDRKSTRLNSSH